MENVTHRPNIQMVDHLVSHLVSPYFIKDPAELQAFCQGAGFYPETDHYGVLVINIERWSRVFSSGTQEHEASKHHFFVLNNVFNELLSRNNIAVAAEVGYQMVCLVNLRQEWDEFCRDLAPRLREVMETLETEFDISITIAVGALAQGISAIPYAYDCAQEALWYNEFFGKDQQVLFYDALCDETRPMIRSELTELDKKLIMKLQSMDIPGIKYVLHEMIDHEFIQSTPTVRILRMRFGGICCKILDALDDIRNHVGNELYYRINPGPRINDARTLTELTTALDDIFEAITENQLNIHPEPKPQWVDKMALYIEEHYTNENLGLTEVSSVFGITPSYATRVFKQYTGRGIYETIQHVRLTAAKALLHTDKTMKQIAEMVGYTSFLSMNRAFKKYEGATPSQFRAQ